MMAFFLLMWLLNATTEDQRKGLADYFDPSIPISRVSGGGNGALNGSSVFAENERVQNGAGATDKFPKSKTQENDSDSIDVDLEGPAEGLGLDETAGEDAQAQAGDDALEDIQEKIDAETIEAMQGSLAEHIHTRMTPDGLVIELVDDDGEPLFNLGSSNPSQLLHDLLEVIGPVLATVSNDMAIVGHTDARPFSANANYTNWELSTDRALAARRMMLASGIPGKQIVQVTGKAATEPFADDPFAAQNRRIAITLLTKK
jgi:chemotaxis protein MotB